MQVLPWPGVKPGFYLFDLTMWGYFKIAHAGGGKWSFGFSPSNAASKNTQFLYFYLEANYPLVCLGKSNIDNHGTRNFRNMDSHY